MAVEKKNILLNDITDRLAYKSSSRNVVKKYPIRQDYLSHADHIKGQYETAIKKSIEQKQVGAIKTKGMYTEFSGLQNFELATKSLENRKNGIRLLNVQTTPDEIMKATVFIPEGKENFFLKRIDAYATEEIKSGKRKNQDFKHLKKEHEKIVRENYGLKTTNRNLNEKIAKEYGYRRWNE